MNNTAPWSQDIVVKPMEDFITNTPPPNTTTTTTTSVKAQPSTSLERKVRPQKEQASNCPRCNSTNTKFCYYNNYSLTQPRYFCKTCRRYWTEGGSLRNIPVGGGSRKNKRPSSSSFTSSPITSSKMIRLPDLVAPPLMNPNPNSNSKIHHDHHHQQQGQDLNLGSCFPTTPSEFMNSTSGNANTSHLSALELLTGLTNSSSRGLMSTPFMPMHHNSIQDPNSVFPSALHFSLDGLGSGNGLQGVQQGRMLFPFADLKSTKTTATTTTTADHDQHHPNHHTSDQQITRDQQGDSTGYWSGILGGAGSW